MTLLAALLLVGTANAERAKPRPISTVSLSAYIQESRDADVGFFDLLNRQEFVTAKPLPFGVSRIDVWNLRRGKIVAHLVSPEPVMEMAISPDARLLVASQAVYTLKSQPVYASHKLFVWNLKTRKLLRSLDLGRRTNILGFASVPGKSNEVALFTILYAPATAVVVRVGGKTYRKKLVLKSSESFWCLNMDTGERDTSLPSRLVQYLVERPLYSLDRRTLATVDDGGEGDAGGVTVVRTKTGKLVSCQQGDQGDFEGHSINGPIFFLSNRILVFSCTNYDADAEVRTDDIYVKDTRTGKCFPLPFRPLAHLRCVSGIPAHPGEAFFLSKQGLELWDVSRQEMLERWPSVKHVDHLWISRDSTVFAVYSHVPNVPLNASVQFWKFD